MNRMLKNRTAWQLFAGLLFLLLLALPAHAQRLNHEKKKEINKTFAVSSGDQLAVDNRYGSITVTHWTRNEVSIRVVIESSAWSEKAMQSNIDRVQIDMNKQGNRVTALTTLRNVDNGSNRVNSHFSIDYYIQMPARLTLDLTQKYGNIKMPADNPGPCTFSLKYGDLFAGSFTGALNVDCKYGNVHIDRISGKSYFALAYSDLKLKNGEAATIDSRYSDLSLGTLRELSLDKKYGNLSMAEGGKVQTRLKYSDATIQNVTDRLIVEELSYGTLSLPKLSGTFQRIEVHSHYGTLKLRLPAAAAFRLEAKNMKYGDYKVKGFRVTRSEKPAEYDHITEVNGGRNAVIYYDGDGYGNLELEAQ